VRRKGRPPQITRQQVAEAAARLGPAGLTVQAVADELSVTRAAIYHYVDDVEELRRLAAYASAAPFAALLDGEVERWQDWLRDFARATRSWRLAHGEPYLVLSLEGPGTNQFLAVIDRAIGVLIGAGFAPDRARYAFKFLIGMVWINAQDELTDRAAAAEELTWWGDPDERFERELDWVIHALEQEVENA
jgi:AcrR family transcriptional regulator